MEKNKFLMKGNEAIAEAAIREGCQAFFGYPITPQTEIAAYMAKRMRKIGRVYLQAESEIAAINMVLGAASTGKRVMTSSSSPGISLKSEAISYIAASDIPCLIVDVQRAGPGLGGIQPSQSDYFQVTKGLGHGDFKLIVLSPSSVQEAVDLVKIAYDLSDKYRVPALILADGVIGQIMEPVKFDDEVLENHYDKSWATNGHNNHRKPNIINSLILKPSLLEKSILDRYKRYEQIAKNHTMFQDYLLDDADIAIIAYGATSRIVKGAVDILRENHIKVGLLRPISLFPFPEERIKQLSKNVKNILVIEMNTGQMLLDVKAAVDKSCSVAFFGRTGGCIPKPIDIVNKVKDLMEVYR